jgi:hypothetical protein
MQRYKIQQYRSSIMQILSQLVAELTPPPKIRYLVRNDRIQLAQDGGQLRVLLHITFEFHKRWAVLFGQK